MQDLELMTSKGKGQKVSSLHIPERNRSRDRNSIGSRMGVDLTSALSEHL